MKAHLESIIIPKKTNYAIVSARQGYPHAESIMHFRMTADDLRAWALRFNRAAEELDDQLPAS